MRVWVLKAVDHGHPGFPRDCPSRAVCATWPPARRRCLEAALTPVVPLPQEQEQLYLRSGAVSAATFEQPSRQVKLWVKLVTPLIKNFF